MTTQDQKMALTHIFYFTLWISTFLNTGLDGCERCTCLDRHGRHFAYCSSRDLTEIPADLPPNVTSLSLSANRITLIPFGSFDNYTQVTSLWMTHNEIISIEIGTLAPLVHLRYFDISHNRIIDFPWEDLENLTALQLLKMNHNEMVNLPKDALSNLKDLRSLHLSNNRFLTIAEGTFDELISLSHLQIYNNPFECNCSLNWLRDWISTTTISVSEKAMIICESPEELKGERIANMPQSKCTIPTVAIQTEPSVHNASFYEDSALILTCLFNGNPKPRVTWYIHNKSQRQGVNLSFTDNDFAESNTDSSRSHNSARVYNNGTLIILHLKRQDSGNYICSAANSLGKAEESLFVEVVALPKPTPVKEWTTTIISTKKQHLSVRQPANKTSVSDSVHPPEPMIKEVIKIWPTFISTRVQSHSLDENPINSSKCGLTANTKYISSHILNGSLDDIKQYTFDFGVIALGVSETEATVWLNPLLIPKDKSSKQTATTGDSESLDHISEETGDPTSVTEKVQSNSLYLCIASDTKHSAVQWTRIKEGVNTYPFSGLRPGTNYSLCLTYNGGDCEVQVLFTTRRKLPNLLIIISVSICLLTVSTVPLLGAMCFHLVYKYRCKTYKMILKAKDQYSIEKTLATNLNIHTKQTESQRNITVSQLDEEEGDTESVDGEKEADTEESVVTESFSLSQCRGNSDDCEVGSEVSDRLPLGAEAVNIINNYKYPNQ